MPDIPPGLPDGPCLPSASSGGQDVRSEARFGRLCRYRPSRPARPIFLILALLLAGWANLSPAAPLIVGLGLDPAESDFLAGEWLWALRGGGAELRLLDQAGLAAPGPAVALLVLDSVPLSAAARRGLAEWVEAGGILVYAGAAAALEELDGEGRIRTGMKVTAPELLALRFAGFDPGIPGSYPEVVQASPLLSPLLPGDALRLGNAGVGHGIRLEPLAGEVLARAARWSPGPGGLALSSDLPTIVARKQGRGGVVFLSFSPGQAAACYPDFRRSRAPTDCSGAGSAHALMRWLAANLLWEYRRLQLPLLWEAPGDRPLAFLVTGDVHDQPGGAEIRAALELAGIARSLRLPLSYYLTGALARNSPAEVLALRGFPDLEWGTHSMNGKVYTRKDFGFLGFGIERGIFADIRAAEAALDIPHFPETRRWLLSTRSHGWLSSPEAWEAMRRAGIGLAFDQVANCVNPKAPWRVPIAWFKDVERRTLFVPLFERSVSSAAGDFRLGGDQFRDIAVLASAQPEPYEKPMPFSAYADSVRRWHRLFARLATVGGLSEVWLWHPGGLSNTMFEGRTHFGEIESVLKEVRADGVTTFVRGDVAASWRANRERFGVRPGRGPSGALETLDLLPPAAPPFSLPPGAPPEAGSLGLWVLGRARIPGWSAREWNDPYGRRVTVLLRPLPVEAAP
jgi:hypothetical protein